MYELPAEGILAQLLLEKRLNKEVYKQIQVTPCFWMNEWLSVSFLCA